MTKYTDTVDVDIIISLHEYGVIRNPETNKTIMMKYNHKGMLRAFSLTIDIDDVKEALSDEGEGFFSCMGTTRKEAMKELDSNRLAYWIMSLNQYSGVWINI